MMQSSSQLTPSQEAMVFSVENVSKMYPLFISPRERLHQSFMDALPGNFKSIKETTV